LTQTRPQILITPYLWLAGINFFQGGNAALTANMGTALFLCHAIDQPVQSLDVGGGFRAWGFTSQVNELKDRGPASCTSTRTVWALRRCSTRKVTTSGAGEGQRIAETLTGPGKACR
jgi:hypothetical protein